MTLVRDDINQNVDIRRRYRDLIPALPALLEGGGRLRRSSREFRGLPALIEL
jgi:hypothetical protein